MTRFKRTGNKLGAIRTYSELCGRWFPSKLEAKRGEELYWLEKSGEISNLEYQPRFHLKDKPKITYTADFKYTDKDKKVVHEDVKGMMSRDTRTKLAWVLEKYGVQVNIVTAKDIR